ncbi:hypothetical protein JTB14_021382 [Gonioctena quinquepunctata]|nr:hypothetical protein JTB14_021382 [Gonioctena quinquepunctata]
MIPCQERENRKSHSDPEWKADLENILKQRLAIELEGRACFSATQFGFRSKRPTADTVEYVLNFRREKCIQYGKVAYNHEKL